MTKLHKEDQAVMVNFVDYVLFKKKLNVKLEILARHLATHLKINPDVTNSSLSRKFRKLLDSKTVVCG